MSRFPGSYMYKKTQEDWVGAVKSRLLNISSKDLSELEEKLREADKGLLGVFVNGLIGESRHMLLYEERINEALESIPDECLYTTFCDWNSVDKYYEWCTQPLIRYIQWLLSLNPSYS